MSVLSERGIVQSKMGGAVDTWRQTWILDTGADLFHQASTGGTVDLLQETPGHYRWKTQFASAVWADAVPDTDLKIGSRNRILAITTGMYYKDKSTTRAEAEAGIEDLEALWDKATWTNDKLVWKETTGGFPPVPPGSAAVKDAEIAMRILRQLPSNYDEFFETGPDGQIRGCGEWFAEFTTLYEINFDNC